MNKRARARGRRSLDGQQPSCFARSGPLADTLCRCAHIDGGGTCGLVGVGDVLERVVAGDGERAVAALVQGDAGIGHAAASECLGRSRGKADGAGAGDGEVGGC